MVRADAFATRFIFHPLRMRLPGRRVRVPILMYHSVAETSEAGTHPYYRTVTTPDVFSDQMQFLHESGYSVINLDEAHALLRRPGKSTVRAVVVTFDDGFRDFHSNAFPILNRHGFSATVFLPTAYVGKSARKFQGTECLTWSDVRELQTAGIHFGSHTVTHPQLRSVSPEQMVCEVQASKRAIEDELGEPVKSFSYPYAFPEGDRSFVDGLRSVLQETGYENGVSTIIGTANQADDPFFMPRLPVNSCDDLRLFQAKLGGGYDWLHAFQYASKLTARLAHAG